VTELSSSERTVAGYLLAEVLERQPLRCANCYGQEGDIVEAIRHAQAARDWPLASRLLAANHLARWGGDLGAVFEAVPLVEGALARRAGRPWLEISPLGHLGVAGLGPGCRSPRGSSSATRR
jgi:hypothetical protein